MPLHKDNEVLAAKVESTVGTAETLTATEAAFNVYDFNSPNPEIEIEERPSPGSSDRTAGIPGAKGGTMSFKIDVEWDGTATLPDWATVLLPACRYVNSAGVFTPRSETLGSNVKSVTIGGYIDGKKRVLSGAVGTFRLVLPTGKKCYFEFTFQGSWESEIDATILAPTLPADTVIVYRSATTTWDSVDMCVSELVLDANNTILLRECPTKASGYVSGLITDHYPRVEADPEAVLVATQDRYLKLESGTEAAISVILDGPSTSTITVSVPKAQLLTAEQADREKLVTDNLVFTANKNGATADQPVSITFTATV